MNNEAANLITIGNVISRKNKSGNADFIKWSDELLGDLQGKSILRVRAK